MQGGFSKHDRMDDDDSDDDNQLQLEIDDHLLYPRHPAAIFAKPIIKKKEDTYYPPNSDSNASKPSMVKQNVKPFGGIGREDDDSSGEEHVMLEPTTKFNIRGVCIFLVMIINDRVNFE